MGAALIGRDPEIARLLKAVESTNSDLPTVIELIGEQGMGKTALLEALRVDLQEHGFVTLRACGFRQEQDYAFGVLIALIDDVLAGQVDLGEIEADLLADLATVLPSLRAQAAEYSTGAAIDPLIVCRAVRQTLALLAKHGDGLAILIDDVHLSDEASVAVVGYLTRHGIGKPLLVATTRHPDRALLPGIQIDDPGSGVFESIEVGPIGQDDARALLTAVPEDAQDSVLHAAGGNPFFLTKLAEHAESERWNDEKLTEDHATDLPPAVSLAIIRELESCSPAARLLAQAAAVIGDPFELVIAGRVAQLDAQTTFTKIDELLRRAIVVPSETSGEFEFRHPIIARVIDSSIPGGWRLAAHERAGRELADTGVSSVRVAGHVEVSAQIGDASAVDLLASAAQDARIHSPKTSVRLLESALRLIPESGPLADLRATILQARVDCLLRAGRPIEGRDEALAALDQIQAGDHVGRAVLTCSYAWAERYLGRSDIAHERLEFALTQMPDDRPTEQLMLLAMMQLSAADRDDAATVRALGDRSLAIARATQQPLASYAVLACFGYCEAAGGSVADATRLIVEASTIYSELPDSLAAVSIETLVLLASAEQWLGSSQEALGHALDGIRFAQVSGNLRMGIYLRMAAESACTSLGQLGPALDLIEETEQLVRLVSDPALMGAILARRGAIALLQGDVSGSVSAAEASEAYLEGASGPRMRALTVISIGLVYLETDRPNECIRLILRDAGGADLAQLVKPARASVFEILTNAALATDDLAGARDWVQRAESAAAETELPVAICAARRAVAMVRLGSGDVDGAVESAQRAVEVVNDTDAALEIAQAQALLGKVLVAADRQEEAIVCLEEVYEQSERFGAGRLSAEVAQQLRLLGKRTGAGRPSAGSQGIGSLTPREREVAGLVADGLRSREIADRLFLSPRTIDSHLANIFAKLDVATRAEVAAAMRREIALDEVATDPEFGR